MTKKVLITGSTGFAGSYLVNHIAKQEGYSITGTSLSTSSENENISIVQLDLNNKDKVFELIDTLKPDYIYHLAALTSPAKSFKSPEETITNNITAELHILEALAKLKLRETRLLITSSAEVYGIVSEDDIPIDEETSLNPISPYAVSKIAQDFLGLQYHLSNNLQVIRVRPFNHIGPGQSPDFVVAAFASQIAKIEKENLKPTVKVGNLESKRDFTDVKDVVKAYQLILEKGKPGEVYNIGSGKSHEIKEILNMLLKLSTKKIQIEEDPSRLKPSDVKELRADITKIKNTTGWEPQIPLDITLKETLDYWRNII